MMSQIVPFLVAEDAYRRDRARREIVQAARRRRARRSRK